MPVESRTTSTLSAIHQEGRELESDINLRQEVLAGLRKAQKELPSKLFYDTRGSQLFDQITRLEEYYLTRTESSILENYCAEIAATLGSARALIEYGSGSSSKTRLLLDHLNLELYVPIDISGDYLLKTAQELRRHYPRLKVEPVHGDYTGQTSLPAMAENQPRLAFFPGSTIGNFHPAGAIEFLKRVALTVGRGGGLLIGVDLKKDPAMIHRAYNDPAGITAAFNLNMLVHINRSFAAEFDPENFYHHAPYNPAAGRIEMHLISRCDHSVRLGSELVDFREGESILTEVSYKFTPAEFAALAGRAGFRVERVWTDECRLFSVQHLSVD